MKEGRKEFLKLLQTTFEQKCGQRLNKRKTIDLRGNIITMLIIVTIIYIFEVQLVFFSILKILFRREGVIDKFRNDEIRAVSHKAAF